MRDGEIVFRRIGLRRLFIGEGMYGLPMISL